MRNLKKRRKKIWGNVKDPKKKLVVSCSVPCVLKISRFRMVICAPWSRVLTVHSLWEMLHHYIAPFWKCLRYICIQKLSNNPEVRNTEQFYSTQFFLGNIAVFLSKDFGDWFQGPQVWGRLPWRNTTSSWNSVLFSLWGVTKWRSRGW